MSSKTKAEPYFLLFFLHFLKMAGITFEAAAKSIGFTRPAVHAWLKVDDAKIDYIDRIVRNFGYRIEYCLAREDEADKPIPVDAKDFIVLPGENYVPDIMAFMHVAMKRYSFTMRDISQKMGVPYSTVRYWFSTERKLSKIFGIAEAFGLSFFVRISKLPEDTKKEARDCKIHFALVNEGEVKMK